LVKKIRVDGEKAQEKALASWENHTKMLHASTLKALKKQKEEAAKILKSTKCSSTKELKAHQTAADAVLHLQKFRAKECLDAMQTEVDESAAFISSLGSDLVTEKNAKCEVVRKYEDWPSTQGTKGPCREAK